MAKIAVTGSSGLIGRRLVLDLALTGHEVVKIDLVSTGTRCDIADASQLATAAMGCEGIINLAAVSRVAEAEQNPARTWSSNVVGTANVLSTALSAELTPWVIQASSREVYGNQSAVAIDESTPINPLNVYGRSKATGEYLVHNAQDAGLTVAILRFANVYGDIFDYKDRVIPAFAQAAVCGKPLRVDDAMTCMDFTHVSDVSRGIVQVVEQLQNGEKKMPPIHFATGQGTTLGSLAKLAVSASNARCTINDVGRRASSVSCFIGDPQRAKTLLGWSHVTPLQDGFTAMVKAYQAQQEKISA